MNRYQWLEETLLKMPGAERDYKEEWGWFRYRVGGKMFAATCRPGPQYKGYDCRELINLKCEPRLAELFRKEYPDVIPGFYCDKRCWNSVFLDGEVPDEVLRDMCRMSYELVFGKLPKKVRIELGEGRK
ncbi:MmcQ/YjbR family DNA-binding protein [Papillibacter cinnamivorans]|uniref:Predicted DNA-binding protein, MmcQ/YjbR family n=1 Tax=Papillibacter cinnamivorans DSM 12816 TaxID=1122930 RepID=A0A1W2AT85_9FIRM|nr:MmcQ/YjbR family DNA-binding protein [Papillibacter cinnamivorans]SMC63913.1 Predicted DNA-binding protein, MmcQ/YjbR family [Papillibacter cinnamivorans DSM 12816]